MTVRRLLLAAGGATLALAFQCASAKASFQPILGVVLESGNPGVTLSKGYTTLETATVECKLRGGCLLSMRIMSNIGNATCKGEWAIAGLINGRSVDGGPYQQQLPSGVLTQTGTWQGMTGLGQGTYSLTFQLNVPCAVTANQWSVRYTVTSP